jgi:hypothetical protein
MFKASFSMKGVEEMISVIAQLEKSIDPALKSATLKAANRIKDRAVKYLAPEDTKELSKSGKVVVEEAENGKILVNIEFGGDAAPYAVVVHEHPSDLDPPSWQGKVIKWTKPGTGPKFLRNSLLEEEKAFLSRAAADIGRFLASKIRGLR